MFGIIIGIFASRAFGPVLISVVTPINTSLLICCCKRAQRKHGCIFVGKCSRLPAREITSSPGTTRLSAPIEQRKWQKQSKQINCQLLLEFRMRMGRSGPDFGFGPIASSLTSEAMGRPKSTFYL